MFMVNHLVGFGAGSQDAPVTAAYVSSNKSETDLTTYSFASQDIGTAAADRIVVVAPFFNAGGSLTISSATLGGSGMTPIITALNDTGSATTGVALYALAYPTGTTATIEFTLSGGAVRGGIGVWTLSGKTGSVAAYDTGSSATGDPTTTNVDIPNLGCLITVAGCANSGALTVTWTGPSEDFDITVGTSDNTMSGARIAGPSAAVASQSVSADWSSAPTRPVLVAASWGP